MKHVNIIIVFICCMLLSCRSSKSLEMKQNSQNDSVSNRLTFERMYESKFSLATLSDTTAWKAKITWFSKPDSTGKQYKQKEADIDYKGSKKNTAATAQEQTSLKSDSTSAEKGSRITTEVKDKKSSKPPELALVLILILIIVIVKR